MMIRHVKLRPREDHGIGDAVVRMLTEVEQQTDRFVDVLAVVPTTLTFFGTSPGRYEVSEAQVIFRMKDRT